MTLLKEDRDTVRELLSELEEAEGKKRLATLRGGPLGQQGQGSRHGLARTGLAPSRRRRRVIRTGHNFSTRATSTITRGTYLLPAHEHCSCAGWPATVLQTRLPALLLTWLPASLSRLLNEGTI